MTDSSAIYVGEVMHARHRPRRHRLRYNVFSLLIDLAELEELDGGLRLFGHNRRALFSFHDGDHGDGKVGGLRNWVDAQLAEAGVDPAGLRIRLLCYPRILGYVFNPLTVYFCVTSSGEVRAILYEVCNTFNERHTYVIPVAPGQDGRIRQACAKELYVSPFVPMNCRYDFRVDPPAENVRVIINESDREGPLLRAIFSGRRVELSDRRLLSLFLGYPLMTFKVIGGIHWEALKIWTKGIPVHRHRKAEKPVAITIVSRLPSPEPERELQRLST
ncbi:DUF1365 domain-containing protein [Ensifer sp.]|jgi:hypothetical protein|uniref:DUF1365 domain-containing protein n=1 Tax=Ensifer sp. TaxID=1872086 RepID=UPI002E131AF2|nr:DUF1365 family protein [Ensifer sp.]